MMRWAKKTATSEQLITGQNIPLVDNYTSLAAPSDVHVYERPEDCSEYQEYLRPLTNHSALNTQHQTHNSIGGSNLDHTSQSARSSVVVYEGPDNNFESATATPTNESTSNARPTNQSTSNARPQSTADVALSSQHKDKNVHENSEFAPTPPSAVYEEIIG